MKLFKQAFTLAEVLITLGIIGIVAAITIPTLMNGTNDAELKNKWKKEFSAFVQATNLMKNDNGGTLTGIFTAGQGSMLTAYSKYLNISKTCATDSVAEGCIASRYYKGLDGTGNGGSDPLNQPGAILADGTGLIFYSYNNGETLNCNHAFDTTSPLSQECGVVYVDVNGLKPPNTMGKDLFMAWITQSGAYAVGGNWVNFAPNMIDYSYSCNPSNTTFAWRGMGCSAMYLMQ